MQPKPHSVIDVEDLAALVRELKSLVRRNPRAHQIDGSSTPVAHGSRYFTFQFRTPKGMKTFGLNADTKMTAVAVFLKLAESARDFDEVLELGETKGGAFKLVLRVPGTSGDRSRGWYCYSTNS